MPVIVVAGHSRKVGKTSVAAGIIKAFNKLSWTAIKISPHRHGEEHASEQLGADVPFHIYEESGCRGNSDTSRFLAAGALRALWVEARQDCLGYAIKALHPILQSDFFVIIESNAVMEFLDPDLCILVLRYDEEEFKDSAREVLRRADAVMVIGPQHNLPAWWSWVNESLINLPQFFSDDPQILPDAFVKWMETRLLSLER